MRAERDVVVGEVRRSGWRKVGFGLYRRENGDDDVRADLVAWQQVLPPSGCLTHLTAAVLHGLWLPPVPAELPVFVSMDKRETRPKRPELVVMRHTKPIATVRREGLVVATPDEALLTCARDLSLLDLVVLGDSALHQDLTSLQVAAPVLVASPVGRRRPEPRHRLDGRTLGVGVGVAAAGVPPGLRHPGRAPARRTRRGRTVRGAW